MTDLAGEKGPPLVRALQRLRDTIRRIDRAVERSEKGPAYPLTCNEVIVALTALVERDAKYGEWPVHLLDMRGNIDPKDEQPWDGLVTHIETDAFLEEGGWVVSLLAWRERGDGKSTPWEPTPIPADPAESGRDELS